MIWTGGFEPELEHNKRAHEAIREQWKTLIAAALAIGLGFGAFVVLFRPAAWVEYVGIMIVPVFAACLAVLVYRMLRVYAKDLRERSGRDATG